MYFEHVGVVAVFMPEMQHVMFVYLRIWNVFVLHTLSMPCQKSCASGNKSYTPWKLVSDCIDTFMNLYCIFMMWTSLVRANLNMELMFSGSKNRKRFFDRPGTTEYVSYVFLFFLFFFFNFFGATKSITLKRKWHCRSHLGTNDLAAATKIDEPHAHTHNTLFNIHEDINHINDLNQNNFNLWQLLQHRSEFLNSPVMETNAMGICCCWLASAVAAAAANT